MPRTFLELDPSRPLHEPGGTSVTGASGLPLFKEFDPPHPLHEPPQEVFRAPRIFPKLGPSYPLHEPRGQALRVPRAYL